MPHEYLDAPLFIKEGVPSTVDIAAMPFFYNNGEAQLCRAKPPGE